jgi:hypothetical protein
MIAELRATLDAAEAEEGGSPPGRCVNMHVITSTASSRLRRAECRRSSIAKRLDATSRKSQLFAQLPGLLGTSAA